MDVVADSSRRQDQAQTNNEMQVSSQETAAPATPPRANTVEPTGLGGWVQLSPERSVLPAMVGGLSSLKELKTQPNGAGELVISDLFAQGRPVQEAHGRTFAGASEPGALLHLPCCAGCVGYVQDVAKHPTYGKLVEPFDGAGVAAHNTQALGYGTTICVTKRKTEELAAIRGATRTVRSVGCNGLVGGSAGNVCGQCKRLENNSLRILRCRATKLAATLADPEKAVAYRDSRIKQSSKVNISKLKPEERKRRLSRRRAEVTNRNKTISHQKATIKELTAKVATLRAASEKDEDSDEFIELSPEQDKLFQKVLHDPKVLQALRKEPKLATNDIAQAFLQDQEKYIALGEEKRGMRWSTRVIRWSALMYQRCNAAGWEELRRTFGLPCEDTLRKYRTAGHSDGFDMAGIQRHSEKLNLKLAADLDALYARHASQGTARSAAAVDEERDLLRQADWARHGCVCFDAMALKKGVWWNKHTHEIEGFEDLENIMGEEISLDRLLTGEQVDVASELLVFWFSSFGKSEKLSHPVAHFYVSKTNTQVIATAWETVMAGMRQNEYVVLCGCCDGASDNRAFLQAKLTHGGHEACKTYYIDPITQQRVYFITCQTHLVKKIRNNLYRSGKHSVNTRLLHRFEPTALNKATGERTGAWQHLKWSTLRKMYDADIENVQTLHRLTDAHVRLTPKSIMRGYLATDVMSEAVSNHLKTLVRNKNEKWSSTQQLVQHTARIFKHVGSGYAKIYTSADDPRLQELKDSLRWFYDWRHSVFSQKVTKTFMKGDRAKQFLSWESWYDLNLTVLGFCECLEHYLPMAPPGAGIRCCRLSQDPCEAYFNYMRTCGGSSTAPTAPDTRSHAAARQMETAITTHANVATKSAKKKIRRVMDTHTEMPLKRKKRQ